jgi:uncharacterized protein YdeI (YjbR/CyaY-like superfamily)
MKDDLPIQSFKTGAELCAWLQNNHATAPGIWVRIYNKHSHIESVTFDELLDEGLCFGWSESMRRKYEEDSYLQRFSPRKAKGTQSARNLDRIKILIANGKMTPFGLQALDLD